MRHIYFRTSKYRGDEYAFDCVRSGCLDRTGTCILLFKAQVAGKKEQGVESLELKLQQLRKARLEENEKELKQMILTYYSTPKDDNGQADPATPAIVGLAKERLRAILEATEQGKKRENLLVPFLAHTKETEGKYKMVSKFGGGEYLYRALILEIEIEIVKAKIAASRK